MKNSNAGQADQINENPILTVGGSQSFLERYREIKPFIKLLISAKKKQKQLKKWEGRRFDLLDTKRLAKSEFDCDAILEIGISGQSALNVRQLSTMERLFKNKNDWRVKLSIWLISKTPV